MSPPRPAPYLDSEERARFDAWLAAGLERHSPPLTFSELRKGVQALSGLYVERRRSGRLAQRALQGAGKRAAFATYFAALHLLTALHVTRALGGERWEKRETILDLGCGTGAAGAGLALALASGARSGRPPRLVGVDRSGWALGEARHTYRALGLDGRALRDSLPRALARVRRDHLVVLGWTANELDVDVRDALLGRLEAHLDDGGGLLLLEPVASGVVPWWPEWTARLAGAGAREGEFKLAVELPGWLRDMDRASGLDHRVLSARWQCA